MRMLLAWCVFAGSALAASDGGVLDAGVVSVVISFKRVSGDTKEGVVSLHARGESDECAVGKTGPERTSTKKELDPLVRPRRELTQDGGVRFVLRESVLSELPSSKALCVRYANGSSTWDLKREAVVADGIVDLGVVTVSPPAKPVIATLACCGGTGPKYDLEPTLLNERLEYLEELEAIGAKDVAKKERSELLETIGTVDFAHRSELDGFKPKLRDLCRAGCSARDKLLLQRTNGRFVLPVHPP